MAKLASPLMSFKASGSLAGAITYAPWKGVQTARSYAKPAATETPQQKAKRLFWKLARQEWNFAKFTPGDTQAWYKLGQMLGIQGTGYNVFLTLQVTDIWAGNQRPTLSAAAIVSALSGPITIEVYAGPPGPAPILFWGPPYGQPTINRTMSEVLPGFWEYTLPSLPKKQTFFYTITRGTFPIDYARLGIYSFQTY